MNRGIDHLVLCVNDLERARAFYAGLGFTLTPPAQHPFGTANSLVQMDGNFIELLSVADASIITPPAPGHFSFAHHNKAYLEAGEGCSMIVFEGHDARSDQAEFKLKQLDTYEPFDFSRTAKLPGGEEVTVGFSLAFVTHRDMPGTAFFTCQQHAPQYFWKAEYQTHANTARIIRAAVMVADDPHHYAEFYRALLGTDAVTETPYGLRAATARGEVRVMSPDAYLNAFGASSVPGPGADARFCAMVIEVTDLGAAMRSTQAGGMVAEQSSGVVRIPASHAFGVDIEFVEP